MAEQENNMEMVEFEFPDETEVKVTTKTREEDIEIEDDTPEQDQGRDPLPNEIVEELEKDELNEYSDRVRTRMSQMKKVWHDERRAKESAAREREEAIRIAQSVYEENRRLKASLEQGEGQLIGTYREAATRELEIAKREYKDAYDSGDTEKVIESQERLTRAQMFLQEVNNYRPQYVARETPLQESNNTVNTQAQRPQVPQPDYKAVTWQERNSWFGSDEEMTSLALGLHEKLVKGGVDPRSDDYYRRIDNTMRKRFPEYKWGDSQDGSANPRAKQAQVVAPATRSTAPRKVVLTKTQVSLAKKLGITPEQYARELIKENRNG
jgi:hypothetical protein